jgi:hypothetical protein
VSDVFQVGFSDEHINGYGDVPYTQVTIEPVPNNITLTKQQKEKVKLLLQMEEAIRYTQMAYKPWNDFDDGESFYARFNKFKEDLWKIKKELGLDE